MRKMQKKQAEDFVQMLEQAHAEIIKSITNHSYVIAIQLLEDCQAGAIELGNMIETFEGEGFITVRILEEYCEITYQLHEKLINNEGVNKDIIEQELNNILSKISKSIKTDIKVRMEVVFLPYKASMWDSLETVWKAADEDPDCDAYVIPIPYYDKNPDGSFKERHYEGKEYPDYVPVTWYEEYDFEKRRPDAIFIHNPYDDWNYVTSVHPMFYSKELKKYTDMLVYIPYFVAGYYSKEHLAKKYITPAIVNADLVMLQSDNHKRAYGLTKQLADKMIVLGNPKIDKVVDNAVKVNVPDELQKKIDGRKVIMVNSSISRLLGDKQWDKKMECLVRIFENNKDLFLLWRPHPLLDSTIEAMRPQNKIIMKSIIKKIESLDNSYVDRSASADIAISISDGLISDYSSLVLQYTATQKPVLLTVGSARYRDIKYVCCDYFSNYFVEDGMEVEDFCRMICENSDDKKVERMRYFKQSIKNCDGTSGKKIHEYVKKSVR